MEDYEDIFDEIWDLYHDEEDYPRYYSASPPPYIDWQKIMFYTTLSDIRNLPETNGKEDRN